MALICSVRSQTDTDTEIDAGTDTSAHTEVQRVGTFVVTAKVGEDVGPGIGGDMLTVFAWALACVVARVYLCV